MTFGKKKNQTHLCYIVSILESFHSRSLERRVWFKIVKFFCLQISGSLRNHHSYFPTASFAKGSWQFTAAPKLIFCCLHVGKKAARPAPAHTGLWGAPCRCRSIWAAALQIPLTSCFLSMHEFSVWDLLMLNLSASKSLQLSEFLSTLSFPAGELAQQLREHCSCRGS